MLLYNITINIDKELSNKWLNWMKQDYLIAAKETGLLQESRVMQLLFQEHMEGITYSVQLYFENQSKLDLYKSKHEDQIHQTLYKEFPQKFVEFKTLLEEV